MWRWAKKHASRSNKELVWFVDQTAWDEGLHALSLSIPLPPPTPTKSLPDINSSYFHQPFPPARQSVACMSVQRKTNNWRCAVVNSGGSSVITPPDPPTAPQTLRLQVLVYVFLLIHLHLPVFPAFEMYEASKVVSACQPSFHLAHLSPCVTESGLYDALIKSWHVIIVPLSGPDTRSTLLTVDILDLHDQMRVLQREIKSKLEETFEYKNVNCDIKKSKMVFRKNWTESWKRSEELQSEGRKVAWRWQCSSRVGKKLQRPLLFCVKESGNI